MKVLIIRFSSFGDVLLTTPIVRAVKQQLNAEVYYLTTKKFAPVIAENPHIDRIFFFDEADLSILFKIHFDYVLDLQKNLRSMALRTRLKGRILDFNKQNIAKWLFVNFKMDWLPDVHLVDRYFNALQSTGIRYDGQGLDCYMGDGETMEQGLPETFTVINCGASYPTKRIPRALVEEIIQSSENPVVLLGGSDSDLFESDAFHAYGNPVFNLIGRTSLDESVRIVRNGQMLFTSDSFLMHAAAAFDKDMVVAWGNTHPKFGMYPFLRDGSSAKVVYWTAENLACWPCSKLGKSACPKGHFRCMLDHREKLRSFEF